MDSVTIVQTEIRKIGAALHQHNLFDDLQVDAREAHNRCTTVDVMSILDAVDTCSNVQTDNILNCPPDKVQMRNLFLRDVLIFTTNALDRFTAAHLKSQETFDVLFDPFPVLPFLHTFTLTTFIISVLIRPNEHTLSILTQQDVVATDHGEGAESIGEFLLCRVAENFDYILREVVFSSFEEGTLEENQCKLCCQVMWKTLMASLPAALSRGPNANPSGIKLDGATFFDLCGNELYFPVSLARILLPVEPEIAIPISQLWDTTKNTEAANKVMARVQGQSTRRKSLPNEETGALTDIYELKKRLACAFIDDDMLKEMIRCVENQLESITISLSTDDDLTPFTGSAGMSSQGMMSPDGRRILDNTTLGDGTGAISHLTPQKLASLQTPVSIKRKEQNASMSNYRRRVIILLLQATARCVLEMSEICNDPAYLGWAQRYTNLSKRMKRHMLIHGRNFSDLVFEKFFLNRYAGSSDSQNGGNMLGVMSSSSAAAASSYQQRGSLSIESVDSGMEPVLMNHGLEKLLGLKTVTEIVYVLQPMLDALLSLKLLQPSIVMNEIGLSAEGDRNPMHSNFQRQWVVVLNDSLLHQVHQNGNVAAKLHLLNVSADHLLGKPPGLCEPQPDDGKACTEFLYYRLEQFARSNLFEQREVVRFWRVIRRWLVRFAQSRDYLKPLLFYWENFNIPAEGAIMPAGSGGIPGPTLERSSSSLSQGANPIVMRSNPNPNVAVGGYDTSNMQGGVNHLQQNPQVQMNQQRQYAQNQSLDAAAEAGDWSHWGHDFTFYDPAAYNPVAYQHQENQYQAENFTNMYQEQTRILELQPQQPDLQPGQEPVPPPLNLTAIRAAETSASENGHQLPNPADGNQQPTNGNGNQRQSHQPTLDTVPMPRPPVATEFPEHFRCAIDGRPMHTPVVYTSPVTGVAYRYELVTLQEWSKSQGDVCPITGEAFQPDSIVVDANLQQEITAFFAAKNANQNGNQGLTPPNPNPS